MPRGRFSDHWAFQHDLYNRSPRRTGPSFQLEASRLTWTSGGVEQFPKPRKVVGISDDGEWAFVEGSKAGAAMAELAVQEPPKSKDGLPPVSPYFSDKTDQENEPPRPGVARESFTLDEGAVVLTWPDNLSLDSFADFEYRLQGVLKRARRKAGLPEPAKKDK